MADRNLGTAEIRRARVDVLYDICHKRLKIIARALRAGERRDHTFQTTDLLHEGYAAVADANVYLNDAHHMRSLMRKKMREFLSGYGRKHHRRTSAPRVDPYEHAIQCSMLSDADGEFHPCDLPRALDKFRSTGPRAWKMVRYIENRYYVGMKPEDAARDIGVSDGTGRRYWRDARVWLEAELRSQ